MCTGAMSWRRLGVLLAGLPVTSRFVQAIGGERWGRTDNLLAGIYDLLAAANWQRGGKKRSPRPKPLPRPGVKPQKYGSESMPIAEWDRRYRERFPERTHRRPMSKAHSE